MLDWQSRVVAESTELEGRIQRLKFYLDSTPGIDEFELLLLQMQLTFMEAYLEILKYRQSNW